MDRECAINKLKRSCDKLIIACKQADMFNDIKDSDSFVHILNWEIPEGIVNADANNTSLIYLDLKSDWRLKPICNGSWREHWTEMTYFFGGRLGDNVKFLDESKAHCFLHFSIGVE